jgi:hypothetical protein
LMFIALLDALCIRLALHDGRPIAYPNGLIIYRPLSASR